MNKTNGKPTWQSATHSIWSYPGRNNKYVIGELADTGGSFELQKIHGERHGLDYFAWPSDAKFEWTYIIADPRDLDHGLQDASDLNDLEQVYYDNAYWTLKGFNLKDDVIIKSTGIINLFSKNMNGIVDNM